MINNFVDTKPYTYSTLCDTYKKFSMPHNQRPYAWKTSHVGELWEVLVEAEDGYFIGNLVCLEPSEESDDSLVIVDGQQRLTTISLFLIAFKYIFSQYEEKYITNSIKELINLVDDYLYWRNPRTQQKHPRLIPGKENLIEIYQNLIESPDVIGLDKFDGKLDDNQSKYLSNLRYIVTLVKKEIKDKKEDEVDKLIQKILSVQFIAIVVRSENDVYDLFEGLNSTGLGLSVADLLKNAVLKSTQTRSIRESIEINWSQIESLFENTKTVLFPKFLRHYWISRNGLISSSRLFKIIKKEKIERKSGNDVLKFTKELLQDAQIYIGFRFEDYDGNLSLLKKDEKTKRIIRVFRHLNGLEQVFEVLLALYSKKLNDSSYKTGNFREDVVRLLNFAILAKFVSVNPSDYEKIFASICESATRYSGVDYQREVGKKFKTLFSLVNKMDEFVKNFSNNLEYGSDSKLIDYLLTEVMRNYDFSDRGIAILDPNIEHILPQNPVKWGFTKEQVAGFVNKIGNLTLLHEQDNNDAGNDILDKKIENIYSKSKFKFNRDLGEYRNIFVDNPEVAIKKRGGDLGEKIFKQIKMF